MKKKILTGFFILFFALFSISIIVCIAKEGQDLKSTKLLAQNGRPKDAFAPTIQKTLRYDVAGLCRLINGACVGICPEGEICGGMGCACVPIDPPPACNIDMAGNCIGVCAGGSGCGWDAGACGCNPLCGGTPPACSGASCSDPNEACGVIVIPGNPDTCGCS